MAHLISQQLETVVSLETIGSLGTVSVAPYTNSAEEQPRSSLGTDLIPKSTIYPVLGELADLEQTSCDGGTFPPSHWPADGQ